MFGPYIAASSPVIAFIITIRASESLRFLSSETPFIKSFTFTLVGAVLFVAIEVVLGFSVLILILFIKKINDSFEDTGSVHKLQRVRVKDAWSKRKTIKTVAYLKS